MRLKNKVAVVTQAGGNFGRAIAYGYAREGADVILQDWDERFDATKENAAAIAKEFGRKAVAVNHDVATGEGANALARQVMDEFGRVDILVNTAMSGGHGNIFDIRQNEWEKTLSRGLTSYFLTCQYIGEEMAMAGYGKIINLTSIVARIGSGGAIPWGACRGGVNALTHATAQALGEYGVRVVALARGATESTPYTEEARNERLLRIPFKRLGTEDDIVGPAIFLATAESDFVTGSIIYADGGYAHAAATDREHRATEFPLKTRGSRMSTDSRELDWLDADIT